MISHVIKFAKSRAETMVFAKRDIAYAIYRYEKFRNEKCQPFRTAIVNGASNVITQ